MGMVKQLQMEQDDDELSRTNVHCNACGKNTLLAEAMYCGETEEYVCNHCGEFENTEVIVTQKGER